MTDYSHETWITAMPRRAALIEGDADAIAAIRAETRDHHRVGDDVTDDAPVFLHNGLWTKGLDERAYEVPDHVRRKYVEARAFPADPVAVMPAPAAEESRRDELLSKSRPVEGTETALAAAVERIRLYHEVVPEMFPTDGELRWFRDGIHLVGPGEDPAVFQAPMDRLADMVTAREYPTLPYLRDAAAPPRA